MTEIRIAVSDRYLGSVDMDMPRSAELEKTVNTDPQTFIERELDRLVARVKTAFGIDSSTADPEALGKAINHVIAGRGYDGKNEKLLGEMVLRSMAGEPVPDAPRPIRDNPQA